ncbi:alpha/beta hydrolase fold domain-containing protein [Mycobacterium asiaticum]|uniref:Esterase n=1 Tax=Mycobacterium asiaticum TaxID=1790 RepID=A0A1A3C5Y9_MYCAS|nr:alpha/beta hydrolase fold domain-containing protein [Mycobacterium asiaticum]OBI81752.1 esterase [Mycobacterium asiaticum]
MTSLRSRAMPAVLRLMGRGRAYASAETARAHIEQRALHPQLFAPPPRLRPEVKIALERRNDWPIYTVRPRNHEPERAVLYLHGGAWVNEITPQHWQLAARMAVGARAEVVVPIYPLVPSATAADVLPTIVELALEKPGGALVGDSAGGQIALSTAQVLRDEHNVIVPRTVLISPVVDLSLDNPDIAAVSDDPWLGRDALRVFADRWRGEWPVDEPRVSPLAGDLAGLGPLTIFTGTRDILNPDARLLAEKAVAAGVDVDFREQPQLLHVYPLMPIPEGRAARAIIVESLTRS